MTQLIKPFVPSGTHRAKSAVWLASGTASRNKGFIHGRWHKEAGGFTLVELMLSTAFIAFILIFMLAAMTEVMGNYNKGLTVKDINQTARTVTQQISDLVQSTDPSTINTAYLSNGRVCFGGVSYVWNVTNSTANKYTSGSSFGMVRVNDPAGTLCASTLPAVNQANATDILSGGIWVQQVNVAVSSNQQLVDITIVLSTAAPNQPTDPGPACAGDSQYCAVANFTTTVSANGGN